MNVFEEMEILTEGLFNRDPNKKNVKELKRFLKNDGFLVDELNLNEIKKDLADYNKYYKQNADEIEQFQIDEAVRDIFELTKSQGGHDVITAITDPIDTIKKCEEYTKLVPEMDEEDKKKLNEILKTSKVRLTKNKSAVMSALSYASSLNKKFNKAITEIKMKLNEALKNHK